MIGTFKLVELDIWTSHLNKIFELDIWTKHFEGWVPEGRNSNFGQIQVLVPKYSLQSKDSENHKALTQKHSKLNIMANST